MRLTGWQFPIFLKSQSYLGSQLTDWIWGCALLPFSKVAVTCSDHDSSVAFDADRYLTESSDVL